MTFKLLSKPSNRQLIGLIVTSTAITGGIIVYGISQFGIVGQKPSPQPIATEPLIKKVTALGRLEPEAEVIRLSTPIDLESDRVAKLLVKESDEVKAGQVVAILNSRYKLQDAVLQAQQQVNVAKARLAQIKAGAKAGEIQAQQATINRLQVEKETEIKAQKAAIARLQAEQSTEIEAQKATIMQMEAQLKNAQVENERYQTLYREGAISASLRDSKHLAFETAQQQLNEARANLRRIQASREEQLNEARANLRRIQASRQQEIKEARATLDRIAEVRPVDVQIAQEEVENAMAALKQAKTNLEQTHIRAPMAGQILKIHTRVGERIGETGIADLAQTNQMMAVAEVYQTDIGKVKAGQKAKVTSPAFTGELQGVVTQIGLQVDRQNIFSNQPGEKLDSRVVEVKIRLNPEHSKQVAGLTNLQVQTAIEL
ncbi:ABC exporter membrane fusion protein [Scytonema sp. NUACC21]